MVKVQLCVLLVVLAASSIGPQRPISSGFSLYDAAAADIVTFGQALAQRRVPAGFVLPESSFAGPRMPVRREEQGESQRPVVDAVRRFNGVGGPLRAATFGSLVLVRPYEEPSDLRALLDTSRTVSGFDNITAGAAILENVRELFGSPSATHSGMIGSGGLPDPACPVGTRVSMKAGDKSPVDVLNEIVLQAPGLVWFVTYEIDAPGESIRVGYLCPDGVFRRTPVIG